MKIVTLPENVRRIGRLEILEYFNSVELNLLVQAIANGVGASFGGEKSHVYL